MNDRLLEGKVGVVTGGGSGMGAAAANAMVEAGAKVVIAGRDPAKLEQVRDGSDGDVTICPTDVTDREQLRALVEFVESIYGRLDLAFNNAGGHDDLKPIDQTSEEEADWVFDLNLKAVYFGMKYQVASMLKTGGGAIVNNASIFGLKAMPGIAHYTASKFGVIGLTRSVALEYADRNIRVNAVAPGATNTPNYHRVTGGDVHAFDDYIPMHRIGAPEEVADSVVWLMSGKTPYCTGSILSIDGGMFAG